MALYFDRNGNQTPVQTLAPDGSPWSAQPGVSMAQLRARIGGNGGQPVVTGQWGQQAPGPGQGGSTFPSMPGGAPQPILGGGDQGPGNGLPTPTPTFPDGSYPGSGGATMPSTGGTDWQTILGNIPGMETIAGVAGGAWDLISPWLKDAGGVAGDVGNWAKENPELIAMAAQAAGGYLTGQSLERISERETAEDKRQFDLSHSIGAGGAANALNRQGEMNPMRDKLLFLLQNRIGQSPADFRPNDIFNPAAAGAPPPQQGGINTAALAQQNATYLPGMGGTNPAVGQQLRDTYLNQAGVTPPPTPVPPDPARPAPGPGGVEGVRAELEAHQKEKRRLTPEQQETLRQRVTGMRRAG